MMVLLAFSACPSVWGWSAVDMLRVVPVRVVRDCHRSAVNRGSRSEMMEEGHPCRR